MATAASTATIIAVHGVCPSSFGALPVPSAAAADSSAATTANTDGAPDRAAIFMPPHYMRRTWRCNHQTGGWLAPDPPRSQEAREVARLASEQAGGHGDRLPLGAAWPGGGQIVRQAYAQKRIVPPAKHVQVAERRGLRRAIDPVREHQHGLESAPEHLLPLRQPLDVLATNLIGQLLAFSRRQTMKLEVINLNPLLQDLGKMLRRVIGEDVELVTTLSDDLGRVKADPGQIEQILLNLAVNARDAMPSGGKLTIETANVTLKETYGQNHMGLTPGHYVMISITDTGLGMTQEVKERIFEPFFTTKEIGKGTGLGLSMVYGIVKQSGGHIGVDSEPGKGATFRIYLPRVDEPVVEVDEKEIAGPPLGNETILVVEDEEEVRKLVAKSLKNQGYKVLEASQGKEAFSLCEEQGGPIHLMVTDVVMPEMTGVELAKHIKQVYPEMKVLYMSGYTSDRVFAINCEKVEKGIEFIQKPFTVYKLARKVREVLDKQFSTA